LNDVANSEFLSKSKDEWSDEDLSSLEETAIAQGQDTSTWKNEKGEWQKDKIEAAVKEWRAYATQINQTKDAMSQYDAVLQEGNDLQSDRAALLQ